MKRLIARILALATLALCMGSAALAYDSVKAVGAPTWVRSGPGLECGIVDTLSTGEYYEWGGDIAYDERDVPWYSVNYSGGFGWVSALHADLVDLSDGSVHEDGRSGSYAKGTSVVAASDTSVYSGPGTGCERIGTLAAGGAADYTGIRQSGWLQISFQGQAGWVQDRSTDIR